MGRFDREENTEGVLPASLGTATQSLRTTVEEKLREIVEAAEARAHEIEDRALESALEVEQDSERKARERFTTPSKGAKALLAAIDTFERDTAEAIGELRQRGEALAAELEAAISPTPELQPEPEPQETAVDDPRETVRRRILDLFLAGKSRGEAERMLGGIEDGGRYVDLLDEVYESRTETQQGTSRRRGGRRRRRPGSA